MENKHIDKYFYSDNSEDAFWTHAGRIRQALTEPETYSRLDIKEMLLYLNEEIITDEHKLHFRCIVGDYMLHFGKSKYARIAYDKAYEIAKHEDKDTRVFVLERRAHANHRLKLYELALADYDRILIELSPRSDNLSLTKIAEIEQIKKLMLEEKTKDNRISRLRTFILTRLISDNKL